MVHPSRNGRLAKCIRLLCAVIGTISLLWTVAGQAGLFLVTDYELAAGEFPRDGADQSIVFDINEDGFAVGVLLDTGVTPVVWVPEPCPPDCQPPGFSAVPLPSATGPNETPTAISNIGADGFINVTASRLDPGTGQVVPIVHRFFNANPNNVTTIALPLPQGFGGGAALDADRAGNVVGYVEMFPGGPRQAMFWERTGTAYSTVPLDAVEAVAVSDDGPVAANALVGARLFRDPATDPDDSVALGTALADLRVHDITEVDRRSGRGALRVAGSTGDFLGVGPGFHEPLIFEDPSNAPDNFSRVQSTPSATPLAVDALGQMLIQQGVGAGQVTTGYAAPGLDPDVHAACQHDPASFDVAICDLAGLVDPSLAIVNAVGFSRGNVIAFNTQGLVAGFAYPLRPHVALSPQTLFLPATEIGQSTTASPMIENLGGSDLVVDDVAIPRSGTPFALNDLPAFPATVAPGDTLSFDLAFSPNAQGIFSAEIVVVSDDPLDPIVTLIVAGTGTAPSATPALSIGDASIDEGADGDANLAVFTVSLDRASDQDVTVSFTTADGTALVSDDDYVAAAGTVLILAGATSATIEVQVVGDRIDESDETFTVELSDPVNATIGDGTGVGTIVNDDDPPVVSIDNISVVETDITAFSANVTVRLSKASPETVTVRVFATDGSATFADDDYDVLIGISAIAVFAPGQTVTTVDSVIVVGDTRFEDDETVGLGLRDPVGATLSPTNATGTLTIINDDAAPRINLATPAPTAEGDTGVTTVSLDITLSEPSGLLTSFDFSTADGSAIAGEDYVAGTGTVSIDPGATAATIEVQVIGDTDAEGNESFAVLLGNAFNATFPPGGDTITVAISDDDGANRAPVAVDDAATGRQGDSLTVNVLANDSDPDGDPLEIVFFRAADDAPEGSISNPGDGTLVVEAAADYSGTFTIDYTIRDGRGGEATATAALTFLANNPPVALDDSATARQGETLAVNVLANDSDPDGDPIEIVDFAVSGDTPAGLAISNPGNGTLVVATPADSAGTLTIGYRIRDGRGAEATAALTVTVGADVTPPTVTIVSPGDGTSTESDRVVVIASATDDTGVAGVAVNGQPATDNGDGTFTATVVLSDGENLVTAVATDQRGNTASHAITVTREDRPPKISVAPVSGDFGRVPVGESLRQTLVVGNDGQGPLVVTGIALTGSSSFVATLPQLPVTLAQGESVQIAMDYRPEARGAHDATIAIRSNDPDTSEVAVELGGQGSAPVIAVSSLSAGRSVDDPSLDFELLNYTVAGEGPVLDTLLIRNEGDADLVVTSIRAVDLEGPVAASVDFAATLPLVVPPGRQATVSVVLSVARDFSGSLSGFVEIASNDPAKPLARGFFRTDFEQAEGTATGPGLILLLLAVVVARNRRLRSLAVHRK